MRSKAMEKIMKEIPLETRIRVSTEAAFVVFANDAGCRKNKDSYITEEDDELYGIIFEYADIYAQGVMEDIKEWLDDTKGDPNKINE